MSSIIENEVLKNKDKNEIFYSLSQFDIYNIQKKITELEDSQYLDIIIRFSDIEIDKIFKLLSTTHGIENKFLIAIHIWETFLCNKILYELQEKELIYFAQNLEKEMEILTSFDIGRFIKYLNKRTTIYTINQIVCNQISRKVRIHYFPDGTMIPIELQSVINQIFSSNLSFNNMLYTTMDSLHSNYKRSGQWLKIEEDYKEIWKANNILNNENFLCN